MRGGDFGEKHRANFHTAIALRMISVAGATK